MNTYYNVFVRSWWKIVNGVRVPQLGRKTYLHKHVTYEDALAICRQYNDTHEPGRLSRKAEFEEVS
jgi:hypothetical protein